MRRHTLFIAIALLMSLFLVSGAYAATRCVSKTLNPSCPFLSIQSAVDVSMPGDLIVVNPGVYYENVVISGNDPANKNNLTITGGKTTFLYGQLRWTVTRPEEVVVDARPGFETCSGPAFLIDNANYITISSLTTRHACEGIEASQGYGEFQPLSSNIFSTGEFTKIDKVISLAAEGPGVAIMGNQTQNGGNQTDCKNAIGSAIVQNSTIIGNQGSEALFVQSNNAVIATNSIQNNAGGVFVQGCNPVINKNNIRQNSQFITSMALESCVNVYQGSDYANITNNTIFECGMIGIGVHGSDYPTITGNIVTGIGGFLNPQYQFYNEPGIGILVQSGEGAMVSKNTVAETFSIGIKLYYVSDATVSGNTITAPGFVGISVGNTYYSPGISPEGQFTKGKPLGKNFSANGGSYTTKILNNKIDYPIFFGIAAEGAGLTVAGNSVSNAGYFHLDFPIGPPEGVYGAGMPYGGYFVVCSPYYQPPVEQRLLGASPSLYSTITNNTATNSGWNGFYIAGESCDISLNTAEHIMNDGFYIDMEGGSVSTNTARYCGSSTLYEVPSEPQPSYQQGATPLGIGMGSNGFEIEGCNMTITGNIAELNTGRGFLLSGLHCTQNSFSSNTSRKNFRTGVRLEYIADGTSLLVINNIVTDNHGEGIANFAPSTGTGSVNITSNTALRNRTDICDEGTASFGGNICTLGDPGCNSGQPPCDLENPFVLIP